MSALRPRPSTALLAAPLACILLGLLGACASIEFTRDTETSGHFVSTGSAFTFLSWDVPSGALLIARENVSDARQPNIVVEEVKIRPYWGSLNWLLEIISWRKATISGTWGFLGDETEDVSAN